VPLKNTNHRQSPEKLSNLCSYSGENIQYPSSYIYTALIQTVIVTDGLAGLWKEAMRPTSRWVTPPVKVARFWIKDQNTDFSRWTAQGANYYITTPTAPHTLFQFTCRKGSGTENESEWQERCTCALKIIQIFFLSWDVYKFYIYMCLLNLDILNWSWHCQVSCSLI